jgi:glucan phosphoethanolaminetransferase (alkaline phosphatase superfamily)
MAQLGNTMFDGLIKHRKEILLALTMILSVPAIYARLADVGGMGAQAVYLALLCAMWAGLVAAAYVSKSWLRWIMALILALAAYYAGVYERATLQFMTYDAFITMLNSAAFAGDAMVQNRSAFLSAIIPALILFMAIGLRSAKRIPIPARLVAAVPLLAIGLLVTILFQRGGDGARGLPDSFAPLAYLTLAGYESAAGEVGPRQGVSIAPDPAQAPRTIVLIVDESIAGQYLDINSAVGVPTPLSREWEGLSVHNYGIAASVTTCSIGSNVTLRFGGTRQDYQRINATMPSVWAYARKAGLRTVYIDAQRSDGGLQNLMTETERAEIDDFIQFGEVDVQGRDMAAASELIRLLADPEPKFILINKLGAHFPVHDKYPDSAMRFTPVLDRGKYADVTDTGSREGFAGSPEDWRRYRNSYRNTLLFNVGEFFERVLAEANLADTSLIYTSDHGQNLHELGEPGLSTHCGSVPKPEEGAVPLVVLEGGQAPSLDWAAGMEANRDRSSHYMIFPTLLRLMHYQADDIAATYGPSLVDRANDPLTFNALFNARLNRDPVWTEIDPGRLAQPPVSDYVSAPAK